MITFSVKSEQAKMDDEAGIEQDPVLRKIASSHSLDVPKLLRLFKNHPEQLTEEQTFQIIHFTSAPLPKQVERLMIDRYRDRRDYLNQLLFIHNARASTKMADIYHKRYLNNVCNPIYNHEDFICATRYGLWNAALRFDLDRECLINGKMEKVKFLTFATPWMFRYVSDMIYKKVNMVPTYSLDAPAFIGDEDSRTLGESIAAKGEDDSDDEQDWEDLDFSEFEADMDNAGFAEVKNQQTMMDAIDADRANEIPEEVPSEGAQNLKQDVDDYMDAMKALTKRDGVVNEEIALKAIEKICTHIATIKDPEERIVTLFASRRYIRQAIIKLKDKCNQIVFNAERMLKGVPPDRTHLLQSLHLDEVQFKKLCAKYAKNLTKDREDA